LPSRREQRVSSCSSQLAPTLCSREHPKWTVRLLMRAGSSHSLRGHARLLCEGLSVGVLHTVQPDSGSFPPELQHGARYDWNHREHRLQRHLLLVLGGALDYPRGQPGRSPLYLHILNDGNSFSKW
ncbi:hypothetical protein HW555_006046, partial [Spodoptera exigua]